VSTAGRSGALSKSITVESDSAESPRLTLTVKMQVTMALGLEPASLRLPDLKVGEEVRRVVRVAGKEIEGVTFQTPTSDVPGLTASFSKSAEGGQLELVVKPTVVGPVRGTVRLPTSHPKHATLTLTVYGQAKGDVSATPEHVVFAPADGPDRVIPVMIASELRDVKVKAASDSQGLVDVTVVPAPKGARLDVRLSEKGRAEGAPRSSQIRVTLDAEDQPFLDIPVFTGRTGAPLNRRTMPRPAPKGLKGGASH